MAIYRIDSAPVRDAVTGEFNADLVGQQVQIVTRDTTTPYPIQDAATDPIPGSLLTVQSSFCVPRFYIDTATPTTVYLDWYDAGSGARGPVNFEEALRQLSSGSVKVINGATPDEDGVIVLDLGGVDDAGMAELVAEPTSATALALAALYTPGIYALDLLEPRPPGIPEGALIVRSAGGGGGPVAPVVYASDDFERTVAAGSLGTPSGGGSYGALSITTDWSVAGGAAIWKAPAAGTRSGFFNLGDYSQSNVEIVGSVSQQSGGAGNRFWSIQPRRIAASGVQYAANIVLRGSTASRPLQVDLGLQKGASEGDMQALLAGVATTGAFGQRVQFRMRVIQVDAATTRVQARVWLEGNPEPTTWQRDATDTTVALQAPGSLSIAVRQNSSETIGSETRMHDYTVQSIV